MIYKILFCLSDDVNGDLPGVLSSLRTPSSESARAWGETSPRGNNRTIEPLTRSYTEKKN